ncbi:MAG: flagellar hook-basal body complex protein FliE [Christensenellaceae bacterium]|jgi:flagellar hook-basal body complex protein FliE
MNTVSGIGSTPGFAGGLTKNSSVGGAEGESFKNMLTDAIRDADDLYAVTVEDTEALLTGDVDNIAQVMINSTKSELALNMVIEVRNKVIDAYNNIMNMQV